MARPARPRGRLAVLGALALLAGPARAEERTLLLDVVVNDQGSNIIGTFTDRDGVLSARAEDLRTLGLAVAPGVAGREAVALDRLPGVRYRLDEANARILFTAEDSGRVPAELGGTAPAGARRRTESGFGALLNYDVNVTSAQGRTLGAGYAEARVFGGLGVLSSDVLAYAGAYGGQESVIRLGTTLRATTRTGCAATAPGTWSAAACPGPGRCGSAGCRWRATSGCGPTS